MDFVKQLKSFVSFLSSFSLVSIFVKFSLYNADHMNSYTYFKKVSWFQKIKSSKLLSQALKE